MDYAWLVAIACAGNIFIGGVTESRSLARWTTAPDQADMMRAGQSAGETDVYFTPASFTEPCNRTSKAVSGIRAFWVDIDAHGEGANSYATKAEAWQAVQCIEAGFAPATVIIDSGRGYQLYWLCEEAFTVQQWQPLAQRLKQWLSQQPCKTDPSRTADAASLMRVPGTFNSKANAYSGVVAGHGKYFPKQILIDGIGALLPAPPVSHPPPVQTAVSGEYVKYPGGLDEDGLPIMRHPPASFAALMKRSEDGTGCAALYHAYTHQDEQTYAQWAALLSTAKHCTDGAQWIHRVSDQYPGYDFEKTERTAAGFKHPWSCDTIHDSDPVMAEKCRTCPLYGKHSAPIVRGQAPEATGVTVTGYPENKPGQIQTYTIPEYPFPFYRGKHGGVYMKTQDEDKPDACVFEHDFYITERINGDGKQIYRCRYHSPHDGVRDFTINSNMIHSLTPEMKAALSGVGIAICGNTQWKLMSLYLQKLNVSLVNARGAQQEAAQQGWQTDTNGNFVAFVHGKTRIDERGESEAAIGDRHVAKKFSEALDPHLQGTFDESLAVWNDCLTKLYGLPGMELHQLVIVSALGTAFTTRFGLTAHQGGIISLASNGSGRGKTVTCQTALRVWGDPEMLTFASKTGITPNALVTNLSYLNSVPLLRDEITEMAPYEIADLIYDSARLGDKERAQGSENDIRAQRGTWRSFFYTSSNNSIYDMIASERDNGDGVMMRVTEIIMPKLNTGMGAYEAQRWMARLARVTGIAGRLLIRWMMANIDEAEELWYSTLRLFTEKYKTTDPERFWVTHLVSACVGAIIGARLGLHPFDPDRIIECAGLLLDEMRQRVAERTTDTMSETHVMDGDTFLGAFFAAHTGRLVIVPAGGLRSTLPIRGEAAGRVDLPEGKVMMTLAAIREFCAKHYFSLDEAQNRLQRLGGELVLRNIFTGTELAGTCGRVKVWEFPLEQAGDTVPRAIRTGSDPLTGETYERPAV
jgi:hypothetical protein|nr:MAG TPA: Replication protein B [Caudoviricetes sp.]